MNSTQSWPKKTVDRIRIYVTIPEVIGDAEMKSKTKLFADVASLNLATFADISTQQLQHRKVGNETYGRDSCIYLYCADQAERRVVERALAGLGHKVNTSYSPGSPVTEVRVSYFKGFHWDE